jgi:lysophospholipase L1-like esterase
VIVVGVATAVLALGTLTWMASRADDPRSRRIDPTATATAGHEALSRDLLVIGDSYVAGTRYNSANAEWPYVIGREMGWKVVADGVAGSGYIEGGESVPFLSRIADLAAGVDPDTVILAGGYHDVANGHTIREIVHAVSLTLNRVRAAFPEAKVVVFSPWSPELPSMELLALADELKSLANTQGIGFIDVTRYVNGDPALLGADAEHPNDAGHRLIALRVIESGILTRG